MEHNASFFSFKLTTTSDNTNHFKQNLKFLQHLLCERRANIAFIDLFWLFILRDVQYILHRNFRIF